MERKTEKDPLLDCSNFKKEDNEWKSQACGKGNPPVTQHRSKLTSSPTEFQCEICSKYFHRRKNLNNHRYRVHKEGNYPCDDCGKTFKNPQSLMGHRRYHRTDEEKRFVCDECGRRFITSDKLRDHSYSHLPGKTLKCNVCFKMYKSEGSLKEHIRTIHPVNGKPKRPSRPYIREDSKCSYCSKTYSSPSTLYEHVRIMHRGLPVKIPVGPTMCKVCQEMFDNIELLKEHVKLHPIEKPFQCAHCVSYTCIHKSQMLMHMKRAHMKIDKSKLYAYKLKYKCPICEKPCQERSRLEKHMTLHNGTRIQCQQCTRSFPTEKKLHSHINMMHSKGKHPCDVCEKTFTTNLHKRMHMKVHSKSFTKQMITNEASKLPRRIVKPTVSRDDNSCPRCPQKFATPVALRIHHLKHIREAHRVAQAEKETPREEEDEDILPDLPVLRSIMVDVDGVETLFTVTEVSEIKSEVDTEVVVKEEPREEVDNGSQ